MISFRPSLLLSVSCFLFLGTNRNVVQSFSLTSSSSSPTSTSKSAQTQLYAHTSNTNDNDKQTDRRSLFQETAKLLSAGFVSSSLISTSPQPANAMNNKSRSENYTVQYTDREWSYMLSGKQYNILRQGGTERPNSSILEGEEREGEYRCAGCATPLFASSAKFHSGTGWPSYASALPGVEVEAVNPVQANLLGAEIRCGTCGGHLGDVFNDGFVYVGTPAFVTGKRFCVDGGALIFKPSDGTEDVFGDLTPPKKEASVPSFLQPPKIVPNNA
jgi:peptide-methionine (R)-S-oxide reductase